MSYAGHYVTIVSREWHQPTTRASGSPFGYTTSEAVVDIPWAMRETSRREREERMLNE